MAKRSWVGWQNDDSNYPCYRAAASLRFDPDPMTSRPLIVRLRNWVGDVILGVPALQLYQGPDLLQRHDVLSQVDARLRG